MGVENMAKGVISELLPYLGLFGQIFLFFQVENKPGKRMALVLAFVRRFLYGGSTRFGPQK